MSAKIRNEGVSLTSVFNAETEIFVFSAQIERRAIFFGFTADIAHVLCSEGGHSVNKVMVDRVSGIDGWDTTARRSLNEPVNSEPSIVSKWSRLAFCSAELNVSPAMSPVPSSMQNMNGGMLTSLTRRKQE